MRSAFSQVKDDDICQTAVDAKTPSNERRERHSFELRANAEKEPSMRTIERTSPRPQELETQKLRAQKLESAKRLGHNTATRIADLTMERDRSQAEARELASALIDLRNEMQQIRMQREELIADRESLESVNNELRQQLNELIQARQGALEFEARLNMEQITKETSRSKDWMRGVKRLVSGASSNYAAEVNSRYERPTASNYVAELSSNYAVESSMLGADYPVSSTLNQRVGVRPRTSNEALHNATFP
jgi:chromosome segregation ATPase